MDLSQVCQVGNPPSPTLLPQENHQFLGGLFLFLGLGVVPWLYQDATGRGLSLSLSSPAPRPWTCWCLSLPTELNLQAALLKLTD